MLFGNLTLAGKPIFVSDIHAIQHKLIRQILDRVAKHLNRSARFLGHQPATSDRNRTGRPNHRTAGSR